MNIKTIVLCALLFLSFVPAAAGDRPYAYWMEETKWTEERTEAQAELKTAWIYLISMRNKCWYFMPDSVISDSVIEDSRVVNEGQMHRIEFFRDGHKTYDYYYADANGRTIPVLDGVSANNGQPYSLDEYHFIDTDGLVRFNTLKYIEMVLWCLNVLMSPWMWFVLLVFLIYKGVRFLME